MTEKKYIDADYLRQIVMPIKDHTGKIERIILYKDVETVPAADVEEVKHGEWEIYHYPHVDTVQCTACKAKWSLDRFQFIIADKFNNLPYYCPNCGAKMDEKEIER